LTWTWYLLLQNPEVESNLRQELDRVFGDRLPTAEDVPRLEYTEMVFAESIRLYPPAWTIVRYAIKDHQVGNYRIPQGSLVYMSQWAMHHSPLYYPNPDRFDPERWRKQQRESRPQFAYFPFGGGSRRCIGEGFAWIEGILLIATIAQSWRFRPVTDLRIEPEPLITLWPKCELPVILEKQKSAFGYNFIA